MPQGGLFRTVALRENPSPGLLPDIRRILGGKGEGRGGRRERKGGKKGEGKGKERRGRGGGRERGRGGEEEGGKREKERGKTNEGGSCGKTQSPI